MRQPWSTRITYLLTDTLVLQLVAALAVMSSLGGMPHATAAAAKPPAPGGCSTRMNEANPKIFD